MQLFGAPLPVVLCAAAMPKGGTANQQVKALNVEPGQHIVGKKRFKFLNFQDLVARIDVTRCAHFCRPSVQTYPTNTRPALQGCAP